MQPVIVANDLGSLTRDQRPMEIATDRTFSKWITRRAAMLGLHTLSDLSEASGIALPTLASISQTGTIDQIDRSARAWLARALKVPLREMESFAAGTGPAIADDRILDLDRPPAASRRTDLICPSPALAPVGRGVAIVARFRAGAEFQWFDTSRLQNRLPVHFPGFPDAFAVAVEAPLAPGLPPGDFLIFRNLPPAHLREGDVALYTFCDGTLAGQTLLGRLTTTSHAAPALSDFSGRASPIPLPLETVVRTARLIATTRA